MVPAATEDIPDLLELIRLFYEEDHHEFREKEIKNALHEILSESSWGKIYLINSEEEIAGYFILTYNWSLEYGGRNIFIDELFIKKKFRGRGLGKKSIDFIEQLVREQKIKSIHLEVTKYNIAKKLYESRGYFSHNSDLMSKKF
jgi:GNAT superfamily N-acetyltransferase